MPIELRPAWARYGLQKDRYDAALGRLTGDLHKTEDEGHAILAAWDTHAGGKVVRNHPGYWTGIWPWYEATYPSKVTTDDETGA